MAEIVFLSIINLPHIVLAWCVGVCFMYACVFVRVSECMSKYVCEEEIDLERKERSVTC